MTAPHATGYGVETVAELREALDALYPGRLALLLVPLCEPAPHQHKDREGNAHECTSPGKQPLGAAWNARAVERWHSRVERDAHLEEIAHHAALGGNIGWTVPPGVLVLDGDTAAAVAWLDAALPDAPMQATAKGAHFVVSVPADLEINATVRLELADGIAVDLRSAGRSQIAVEPSRHATGSLYTWKRALPADLAELPECRAALLERIVVPAAHAPTSSKGRKIREGGRNSELHRIGCGMRGRGLSEPEIREELRRENARRCDPPLDAGEVDSIAESVLRYAAGEGDPRGPRPEIVLDDRQLDAVVDDAVAALVAANDPPSLFLRGGAVVSIRRDEDGRPIVAEVAEPAIVERLARAARWFKHGRRNASRLETGPTASLASTVLQRLLRHATALPALRGVTESPLLRADGSILDGEGYDAATRLYYAPAEGFALARVPEQPTALELEAARALLDELLGDFPTVTDGDYATALAALLTVPLRELVSGCVPAQLFDAPAPGTGKGLLADAVAMIATGGLGAKASEPDARSDDEWRKRITALLLEGRAVCVLDNVERPIGSPSLAAALTTSVWSDRVLGSSKMLTLPNRAVWIATGNNLRLRGDLPRRCVWCRLDARMARPWTREGFRHPGLLGWAQEHRSELLAAVFTLARAWISAGRPEPDASTPRLGSFESWRHVVGGTLRVAGVKGFLANLAQLYDLADDDTPAWAAFLATWRRFFGESAVSVAQLLETEREGRAIAEALPPELAAMLDKPASAAKRIGHALKRKAETRYVVDDAGTVLRLVRDSDTSANRAAWRVLP